MARPCSRKLHNASHLENQPAVRGQPWGWHGWVLPKPTFWKDAPSNSEAQHIHLPFPKSSGVNIWHLWWKQGTREVHPAAFTRHPPQCAQRPMQHCRGFWSDFPLPWFLVGAEQSFICASFAPGGAREECEKVMLRSFQHSHLARR